MAYTDSSTPADKPSKRAPKLANTLAKLVEYERAPNIAELLEDQQLSDIGYQVEREYKIDKQSRSEWEESANKAMDVALQVRKPKNYPFEGAANIKFPLVTVAALQFGARAYPAIVDGNHIVKGQVLGSDDGIPLTDEAGEPKLDPLSGEPVWAMKPGAKRAKSERVSRHMSYQLLNEMEEWEEDTDVLLHHIPIVGCAFRKVWRSEELGRNKSEMIPAVHLVVNNAVRNLAEAPRVTHEIMLYPQDIEDRKRAGIYLDVDLPTPTATEENGSDGSDEDAPHMLLEQHRYLDLDEDGYREPYIVTVHKETCKVLRIVANFEMDQVKDDGKRITRIPKSQYFVKYSFIPDPKGGFYDIGFGKLLESLGETIDTTINQMLDAGHLSVAGGGFISTGVRLKKNRVTVSPGRYEFVETSGDLRASILPHQFPEPSAVLFNLLGLMVDAAKDITATKDILTGDAGGKTQTATTTLALIEQGLKVFTAIYKRIYRALKDEFRLLFELNAKFLDEKSYFTFNDEQEVVAREDYDLASMDICPVADPSMVTDMQRQAKSQLLLQLTENPILGPVQDPAEVLKRIYETARIEDADKLIKKADPKTMQIQEQGAVAEIDKVVSEAEKNRATATKALADAGKAEVEAALLPADKMLEAHATDEQSRQADEDRMHGTVESDKDRAIGMMEGEANRKAAADKAKAKEAA